MVTVLLRGLVLEDSRAWGLHPSLWLPLLLGQSSGPEMPRCCLPALPSIGHAWSQEAEDAPVVEQAGKS